MKEEKVVNKEEGINKEEGVNEEGGVNEEKDVNKENEEKQANGKKDVGKKDVHEEKSLNEEKQINGKKKANEEDRINEGKSERAREAEEYRPVTREKKESRKKKFRLTGSMGAKILAFFLMVFGSAAGLASLFLCYVALEEEMYTESRDEVIRGVLRGSAYEVAYVVRECLESGYEKSALSYLEGINGEVAVLRTEDRYADSNVAFVWQSYDKAEGTGASGFFSRVYEDVCVPTRAFDGVDSQEAPQYIFRVFYDLSMEKDDDIKRVYEIGIAVYGARYVAIMAAVGSGLLVILCFVFLMCSAGHRNGREGIVPGVFTGLHFDVATALFIFMISVLGMLGESNIFGYNDVVSLIFAIVIVLLIEIMSVFYLMSFAIRLKLGKWWRHTLTYQILRAVWRAIRFLGGGLWRLLKGMPLVMTTLIAYLGICILEFFGVLIFVEAEGAMLWLIEKLVLLPVVLYIALTCRRLLQASEELSEGREDYRVDTRHMFGAFKEHGENLNSLGRGISKAVEERLKSERLKTELITNVSHDLKTPLTSIINYAELICQEKAENPKIGEYSEVLLRQSRRLKKLLEDLVEASKATTGNLEVDLKACEVGVLLTQAVGEYQQRMEEKGLDLRASQPEEPVMIMADGRRLWRIFDNLLNNICKYAQENTRVYLSLEQKEDKVFIIFRNMSKYALNISPEELEERFVRGDKSRHMEGNGLGLSIAKSLAELQNGVMDIVIDGDLFKVILTFEVLV